MDEMYIGHRPRLAAASTELLSLIEDMIKITQALQEPEIAQGVMVFIRQNMEHVSVQVLCVRIV